MRKTTIFVKSIGMVREEALSNICNKDLRGNWTDHYKCHLLHHFDPFLKLGPFKLEIKLDRPYRAVFHDILTDNEIQHMIDLSIVSAYYILEPKHLHHCNKIICKPLP